MTCVWDGLCTGLNDINIKMSVHELANYVKLNNKETTKVKINGKTLTEQEINENVNWIKSISNINDGYWCSTSDPLFCLFCELFEVNLNHTYNKTLIQYIVDSKTTIHVKSNNNHFTYNKTTHE